jgi:hypothetical protein
MDHFGPWVFVAVLVIGSVARAVRRFGAGGAAPAPAEAAARRAAELARGRPAARPPASGAPAGARPPGPGTVRTTAPTRRVPLAAGLPAAVPPGTLPELDEIPPSPGGRALADALRKGSGLRNAVVLAEVLAPPVALR